MERLVFCARVGNYAEMKRMYRNFCSQIRPVVSGGDEVLTILASIDRHGNVYTHEILSRNNDIITKLSEGDRTGEVEVKRKSGGRRERESATRCEVSIYMEASMGRLCAMFAFRSVEVVLPYSVCEDLEGVGT